MKDAFESRRQALEDSFREVDFALVELMREHSVSGEARQKLSESTGITNEPLLDELLDAGIEHSTVIAFVLLPLAQVGWADGKVDDEERTVILNTALGLGYQMDSPGIELLKSWLEQEPSSDLFAIWCEYAGQLTSRLSEVPRSELAATIITRGKLVAEATGGVLHIGRISREEKKVLQQIQTAFSFSNED